MISCCVFKGLREAGGSLSDIANDHQNLSFIFPDNKKNALQGKREAFEVITRFYFLLPATNWNEMISHGDGWENHCAMPAGWSPFCFLSLISNTTPSNWAREQKTTFNFTLNPTTVFRGFSHCKENSRTMPPQAAGDGGLTAMWPWRSHLSGNLSHS